MDKFNNRNFWTQGAGGSWERKEGGGREKKKKPKRGTIEYFQEKRYDPEKDRNPPFDWRAGALALAPVLACLAYLGQQ